MNSGRSRLLTRDTKHIDYCRYCQNENCEINKHV